MIEEVEAANLVRAVVLAVTSADATVVDLDVQAFVIVNGRENRANGFAGAFSQCWQSIGWKTTSGFSGEPE